MSINSFDAVVMVAVIVSAISGFRAGLVRSLASILGYVSAMPLAVAVATRLSPTAEGPTAAPIMQNFAVFFGVFLVAGLAIGALLRFAVDDLFGRDVGAADRLAGACLGLGRIALVAVGIVMVFDRMIPADRQPAYLRDSRLKPVLSQMGRQGLQSLPPDLAATIDQLKLNHTI